MLQVFGIPNCDTVKKARRFLDDKNITYQFNDFKKNPPTIDQLKSWERQVGEELVNKRGRTFRQIKDDYERLDQIERLELLQKQASAIRRPILEWQGQVLALGFDQALVSKVLLERLPTS